MIIDKIRDFMNTCPFLENGKININCLGGRPVCYSIEQIAAEPIVKTYCDGGVLKQCRFVFAVRDNYDEVPEFNLKAAELMEQLEKCMSDAKNLWDDDDYYTGQANAFEDAIEIVKDGVDNKK